MKNTLFFVIAFFGSKVFATTHYSTINSFAPATRQGSFTTLEEGDTLDHKNINAYIFTDLASQSLSVYGVSEGGEDILSFLHVGVSYGFTEKLEFGFRGQAVVAEFNNENQTSIEVASRGFTNFDGFIKYNFYKSSRLSLSTVANIGYATGDNIFFIGPEAGPNFSVSLNASVPMNKWKLALGTAYLKRTPGERDPSFTFFEPIESSIIFNVGVSRVITKASNISLEIINASHDVVIDNSDREDLSSEALLSLHTKFKNAVLTFGGGFGLTDGIAVPAARAFLGLQYTFGPRAKKAKDPVVEEPVLENEVFVEEPLEEPIFEEEPIEQPIFEEEPVEEPVYIEEDTDFNVEEPSIPQAPSEDQKFILNNIEFQFDSYELNQGSRRTLDEVFNYLQTNNYKTIEIWGHTDFVGSLEYNEYLGLSRAQAVFKYLREKGIPESSMKYDSFGERRPVNTGLTNDFRRKNRRVEIILIK